MFLTVAVCTAQVLAQLGAFTFFALLPTFFQEWDLSHSEAGILNGIIFGAYALSVPLVVPLTDRLDPRRIYICAVGLTTCSHLGMAFMADGFWDGFLFRALAGIGWGGTYMVGLKALADLIEGPAQSRAVAFHAASIGIGGSLSFVLAGWAADIISWQAAFQLSAAGSFLALLVMAFLVPGRQPQAPDDHGWLAAFLRAFRNKSAIAYSLGYCVHTWEMFTLRSWVVTFLVFTAAQGDGQVNFLIPTTVAMLMELTGTAASVIGNEFAIRVGRRRWILTVMLASMVLGAIVGFSAGAGYGAAATVCLLYNMLIYADSSSLTAGAVGTAEPGRRGATLAVHGMLGYSGGFVGPLLLGVIMDLLGGETVMNWGVAFAHVSVIMVIGPLAIKLLRPGGLPGDLG
ncbi:MAG: MFS transporter [Alphaproteobacteria bacterium]|nr:MFS transporter [Alphaproteobacteria bacterium]MDP6813331.1 MFS transporter [Alphaproteobacteria bacterium]